MVVSEIRVSTTFDIHGFIISIAGLINVICVNFWQIYLYSEKLKQIGDFAHTTEYQDIKN